MHVLDLSAVEANGDEALGGAGQHDPTCTAGHTPVPGRTDRLRADSLVADVELRGLVERRRGWHVRAFLMMPGPHATSPEPAGLPDRSGVGRRAHCAATREGAWASSACAPW